MHYKLGPDIIVKTENAAKPEKQASSYLKELLSKLPTVDSSFDYGCGKLRYVNSILGRTNTLSIVDSEIQLSRAQKLKGINTSIRRLLNRSNRISIYNDEQFSELNANYDRGFCINVLSVIPIIARRRQVLNTIREKLRPRGTCLFVVQYRNSDFTRMSQMSNARPWRDGFLIESRRGYSFYGLIRPERLIAMVKKAGFSVEQISLNEGSAYLLAGRR
jgi:hypothetical protein